MSKKLTQNQLKLAEYARLVYSATPEPGVPFEDILKPEYWAHVARQFAGGTRIEVVPEDRSYFAELFVRAVSDTAVTVAVMRHIEFEKQAKPSSDNGDPYEIKHRGGAGWSVIRKSDKAVIFEKGQTRVDAERFIEDQLA